MTTTKNTIVAHLLLSIVLLTIVGCSTSTTIERNGRAAASMDAIQKCNREFQGKTVTIRLTNGRQYVGENISLSSDSLRYDDRETLARMTLGVASIERLEWKDRLAGGLDGFILSIAPAILVGSSWNGIGWEGRAPEGSIVAGSLTVAGGVLMGITLGHRNYYDFSREGQSGH